MHYYISKVVRSFKGPKSDIFQDYKDHFNTIFKDLKLMKDQI